MPTIFLSFFFFSFPFRSSLLFCLDLSFFLPHLLFCFSSFCSMSLLTENNKWRRGIGAAPAKLVGDGSEAELGTVVQIEHGLDSDLGRRGGREIKVMGVC
jgi:hypothetical protein